jgi:hypothetical protein
LFSWLFLYRRRSISAPDACDFTVTHFAVSPRLTRVAPVALSRLSLPRRAPDPVRRPQRPRCKSIKSNLLIHMTFSVEHYCKQGETSSKIYKFSAHKSRSRIKFAKLAIYRKMSKSFDGPGILKQSLDILENVVLTAHNVTMQILSIETQHRQAF